MQRPPALPLASTTIFLEKPMASLTSSIRSSLSFVSQRKITLGLEPFILAFTALTIEALQMP